MVCGVILSALAVPFFAFPKTISREKERLKLDGKKESVQQNDSFVSLADRSADASESSSEYGKSLKGKFTFFDH